MVLLVQQAVSLDVRAFDHDVVRHRGVESELLLVASDADVLRVEDERTDPACSRRVLVGARKEQERPGVAAVRDPLLRAGDRPPVGISLGLRAQRARVGAGLRLREREGAEVLTARKRRDEARLLLIGAVREQRERHGARVHGDGDADSGVRA